MCVGKCPLFDDKTIDRHVQEANEAEERAILEARAEDNTIEEDTLRVETKRGKGVNRDDKPEPTRRGPLREPLYFENYFIGDRPLGPGDREMMAQLEDLADLVGPGAAPQHAAETRLERDARHARWLQNLPPAPVPFMGGFEPQGIQPLFPALTQFQNNQFARPGTIPQPNIVAPQPSAFDYRAPAPMPFDIGPQPPMGNPDPYNAAYLDTAQRIHNFREQQEQRRRGQFERRNTIYNQVPQQVPNPQILNVRNNNVAPLFAPSITAQNNNLAAFGIPIKPAEATQFNYNAGLNLGTQPPVNNLLGNAFQNPAIPPHFNTFGSMNGNSVVDDVQVQDFLNNSNLNPNHAQTQNRHVPQPGRAQAHGNERARRRQNRALTITAPNGVGVRDENEVGNVDRNRNMNGNGVDQGRHNRRQTMPLDGLNAGTNESRWDR